MQTLSSNLSVKEAIAAYSRIKAVKPNRIQLHNAVGMRVAEDVVVRRPQPPVDIAACEGLAIPAAVTAGASCRNPVSLGNLVSKVNLHGPLPPGTDAVLPVQDVAHKGREDFAIRSLQPGENVISEGHHAAEGTVLVRAGARLSLANALAAGACGIMDVLVRRPIVDIIFNSADFDSHNHQMIHLLARAVRGEGCEIGTIQSAGGKRSELSDLLLQSSGDIIATIGGTGNGTCDHTLETIASVGEVIFHGVRLEPGQSVGFGMVQGKPVFAAPGGLVEMTAVNMILSPSFTRRALGRPPAPSSRGVARLTEALSASPDKTRLILAVFDDGQLTPMPATVLTPVTIASSNAAILLPEGSRHKRKGERISFLKLI